MKRQSVHLFVAVILALLGPLAQKGRGDFILWYDEQITVNSSHSQGILYDTSRAFIVSGGSVNNLYARDFSTANISGGSVTYIDANDSSAANISGGSVSNSLYAWNSSTVGVSGGSVNYLFARHSSTVNISGGSVNMLRSYNSSTANISGGSVSNYIAAYDSSTVNFSRGSVSNELYAGDSSTVNISGGSVNYLKPYDSSTVGISGGSVTYIDANDSSTVDISGGSINNLIARNSTTVNISDGNVRDLAAYYSSIVTLYGQNFRAGGGLYLEGERVLGTGFLIYEWMDGTRWTVIISNNEPTATILAITKPTHILTIDVDPNDVGIDTITPSVGAHDCAGRVNIDAQKFAKCPDVYVFDHWDGDVTDANSADTTVFMDSNKTITAVFVDDRQCGDECHPYPIGDLDKDCEVTFGDFALFASHWLDCTKPECD